MQIIPFSICNNGNPAIWSILFHTGQRLAWGYSSSKRRQKMSHPPGSIGTTYKLQHQQGIVPVVVGGNILMSGNERLLETYRPETFFLQICRFDRWFLFQLPLVAKHRNQESTTPINEFNIRSWMRKLRNKRGWNGRAYDQLWQKRHIIHEWDYCDSNNPNRFCNRVSSLPYFGCLSTLCWLWQLYLYIGWYHVYALCIVPFVIPFSFLVKCRRGIEVEGGTLYKSRGMYFFFVFLKLLFYPIDVVFADSRCGNRSDSSLRASHQARQADSTKQSQQQNHSIEFGCSISKN